MKNLEIEYKKIIEENVPDLWDRIEAGIDKLEEEKEKETAGVNVIEDNKKIVAFERRKKINRIVPVLVAAAAFVLAFGLFTMSNGSRKSSSTTNMAAADMAPCEEAAVAADAEMDDSVYDFAASESTNNMAAEAAEEAAPAMAEMAEAAEEAVPAALDTDGVESVKGSNSEDIETGTIGKSMEYYGKVTLCEDPAFIEVVMEDGNTVKMFVPSEYRDLVAEAADEELQLEIVYEEIDKELIGKFPEEYRDTMYQIYKIKK